MKHIIATAAILALTACAIPPEGRQHEGGADDAMHAGPDTVPAGVLDAEFAAQQAQADKAAGKNKSE